MNASESTRVIVVGAGGHARVCIEALFDSGFDVVGCVSRDGAGVSGLPCRVLGRDEELVELAARIGVQHVFVGVGDNHTREFITARCRAAGLAGVNAVSRFAMVSAAAELGVGVAVLPGAVVNPSAIVADGAIVNTRASIDHDVYVGPFAHVAVGASLAGGVTVGERALLGVGSCVVPLVRIGADAVVGAGAAVVRDVPAGATVLGVPARERTAR